ncbi:mask [Symbiodinium pilosum]|uniref:Mask protein n=1 Tax=Symbiodinium pilosum TaxID=2952 RepID=A0A812PY98_SYMPI|nr:mask [Symbiodinium pilosum]
MLQVYAAASGDLLAAVPVLELDQNAPFRSLKKWLQRHHGLPEFMCQLVHGTGSKAVQLQADAELRSLVSAEVNVELDLLLLPHPPDGQPFSSKQKGEALHCLCAFERLQAARALIQGSANPDFRLSRLTPLDVALNNSRWEVVRVLLEGGASKVRDVELGPNINKELDGMTPLFKASKTNDVQMLRLLLMARADTNKPCGIDYDTPLGIACSQGFAKSAAMLLEVGASIAKPFGSEPLLRACREGHTNVVSLLLQHRADKDQVFRPVGCTPLSVACEYARVQVVQLLLERRANPRKVFNEREPGPLYMACQTGNREIVELLLQAGVCTDQACGFDLDVPLQVASRQGHHEVVELLQQANASSDIVGPAS